MSSREFEQRATQDEYLMGRSLRTEAAARNFLVSIRDDADLASIIEEIRVYEGNVWDVSYDPTRVNRQGVLDLPVFEALTLLFRKTSFYEEKDALSPRVNFPDIRDPHPVLRVDVQRVDSYSQFSRTIAVFDIPNLHEVLETKQDLSRARRLGLLGGTAATFSVTKPN